MPSTVAPSSAHWAPPPSFPLYPTTPGRRAGPGQTDGRTRPLGHFASLTQLMRSTFVGYVFRIFLSLALSPSRPPRHSQRRRRRRRQRSTCFRKSSAEVRSCHSRVQPGGGFEQKEGKEGRREGRRGWMPRGSGKRARQVEGRGGEGRAGESHPLCLTATLLPHCNAPVAVDDMREGGGGSREQSRGALKAMLS